MNVERVANGVQIFIKKDDVGEIYTAQVKESSDHDCKDVNTEDVYDDVEESTEQEWQNLNTDDVRDVYVIKFNGQHEKQYDFRILTSRKSKRKGTKEFLLFEASKQLVYGEYYIANWI